MKPVTTRRSTRLRAIFVVLITSVTMLAAACGDSSDTEPADAATATISPPTTIPIEPPVDGGTADAATATTTPPTTIPIEPPVDGGTADTTTTTTDTTDTTEAEADLVVEITIIGDIVSGVGQRVEVELGSIVEVTITADVDEQVHLHGYDEFLTLIAGEPAVMVFEARIPGVFEAELEGRGQRITEFEVS
ncbi:MAG: hypothetical protein GXP35_07180 [Actinobacteria bacterium]|nr:hypothetical protein [Actinomycetota bacterium]